jgi:hypothetical protein
MMQFGWHLARKPDALEKKNDAQFKIVFEAIRQLMIPPAKNTKRSVSERAGNEAPEFVLCYNAQLSHLHS